MTNPANEQLLKLHYILPLSWEKVRNLMKITDDFDEILHISPKFLASQLNIREEKAAQLIKHYKELIQRSMAIYYDQHNITPIPYADPLYPERLKQLYDAPAVVYAQGDVQLLNRPKMMAVIGSRAATSYSENVLKSILPPLIREQYIIVSGLAKGADRLAHEATIRYGGKTIGVLGHGLFHNYPPQNKELNAYMASEHLLITEYPPYVGVQKWHFPARNRIISGLCEALVVTEAALKSGTLITTELALEQGKDVFAVPGNIFSEQSRGTNKLIKEGAIPVWDGFQILEEIQLFSNSR
ncbi:predicted Rossmann fold nucleotide-binding protein [Solibacillus silvestris StLB046]|uniref:Predicted Rossmann fold nucleotide-binding protein n=1 Tax=Solibacillus silvestris (strain StLB046) TaxID=1002809 RepID=F2F627_SOLSS|nr:DNA-processing protein DprA [Solibacillus silvestris]BAK17431.1 predicted Rossmann fold nucleotide-binding protein [Solibacillus silvestris StLB046]